jgi:hypothetical protein
MSLVAPRIEGGVESVGVEFDRMHMDSGFVGAPVGERAIFLDCCSGAAT